MSVNKVYKVEKIRNTSLEEALNNLANDGWEAINFVLTSNIWTVVLVKDAPAKKRKPDVVVETEDDAG